MQMESAYKRGEKSVLDWIKYHHSDYSAKDVSAGLKEGNPSAASFMKFQAFTTAAVQDQRIRTRMKAAMAGNIKRGENKEDFRKVIDAEFDKAGLTKLHPHQVDNIYYTNTSLAFGAGQMQQLVEVSGDFPYWKYSATMDSKTRPDHAALHGKIFRTGDYTFFPPIGFRCRCTAIPLTARQAQRLLGSNLPLEGGNLHTMPSEKERQDLLDNTGNAEFMGNKNDKYMKWLAGEYNKADAPTQKLIDQALSDLKKDIDGLQKEGLKQFFDNDFIKETWDNFREDVGFTAAAQAAKMSTKQAYYIHAYTHEAPLYQELNAWLFKGDKPTFHTKGQLLTMKRQLAGALKKMPKYEGTVYRQVPELPANVMKQYQPGKVIEWDGFSSASKTNDLYDDRKVMFIIDSKSSRQIENLSVFREEKETLFLPGKFKVTERQEQGDRVIIKMKEL